MTTTRPASNPSFAVAGALVEAFVGRDFDGVASTLEPDATMSALLPRGSVDWQGSEAISGAFAMWFGDVDRFDVADAEVGHVGGVLQIRWRARVQGGPRFPEPMICEQCLYATTSDNARINRIRLLCSGFQPEH
jgi:hypothetical protein